ncbi:hypothetical protein DPMN_005196 [Dreissena polymorpha]|uniref:Uncharacterized protein n=1 Tax=Dreissena polymorpha TaxID=45954 RepID=A0A9D4MRP9_DREPO|nr:hypothetical protein DPMN_005196 [Dreissena polymorpha]
MYIFYKRLANKGSQITSNEDDPQSPKTRRVSHPLLALCQGGGEHSLKHRFLPTHGVRKRKLVSFEEAREIVCVQRHD